MAGDGHERRDSSFADIWQKRSPAELRELAHIKRFMECVVGDPEFRRRLEQNIDKPETLAQELGLDIDPKLMRPLFHVEYMRFRHDPADERWPLARRWDAYVAELLEHRASLRDAGDTEETNPRFHRWRRRQIARVASELGPGADGIVHPIVCYELSRGCTVGCWFCGISAEKFAGYFAYTPQNERLWKDVLGLMKDRFGPAAQTGFCYWATDPSDNPDYVKFLRAHNEVTGRIPQTTTAAPLKNLPMTREVLELFNEHHHVINRFSILSIAQLRRVHSTFTPEELLGVELVQQHTASISLKSLAGRARERKLASAANATANGKGAPRTVPGTYANTEGTIACVSGFLVNMLEGRIRLISPTRAGPKWPDGYRIYGEARFGNADEFGAAIDTLIDQHMPLALAGSDRLGFRADLKYEDLENGFRVSNDRTATACNGAEWIREMGALLQRSDTSVAELIAKVSAFGPSVFSVMDYLDDLFQAGVLNEDPDNPALRLEAVPA